MTVKCLIALLLLTCILRTQDWGTGPNFNANEGFSLPHIYADDITLVPATGATTVDVASEFTTPINSGSFSSGESLYIGTGKFSFNLSLLRLLNRCNSYSLKIC